MAGNPQQLSIEVTNQVGPAKVVRVAGSVTMDSGNQLRDRLMSMIEPQTKRLILDLEDLEFINSLGLGGIVAAHLRMRNVNSEIHLAAPRPHIRELLDVTRLTKLFPVHASVASALATA